ncbi:UDP-N-acetylmuramoyl-tripeptide--D-alanyl-D-alanine ligase [Phormidium tenue FACHB-886]|nr:UDP-N-acetylmuramoyl-tripeptide--D-alanyl-D-alanine ligase [Phormidium tenue FACHB-886]
MACRVFLEQLIEQLDHLNVKPLNISESVRSQTVAHIVTDSRSIQPGEVFLALRGDRFDGHAFVEGAIQQGAIAAIVDSALPTAAALPLLLVPDTLQAYQTIGRWWRDRFQIPVIAVTGSVGKTTTKELIAAVLSTQGQVLKTQANYNNEIGVPKTLLELNSNHDYAVIEMGMRAVGEIALLTRIARPDIAVITNVGTAHIGRLGSEQAIAYAKCELLQELPPTGIAILNHDNPLLMEAAARIWQGRTITYGLEGGDLQGELINSQTLAVDGMKLPLPLPGRHNALNYLAALAVAKVLQIDRLLLAQGVTIDLPKGRAQRLELPNDIVILDETYNAGLESMTASLHLLAETPGQRRIAVLGTMKELGDRSPEFHHQVGHLAQALQLDALLILADEAESQAMAAGAAPLQAEQFSNPADLVNRLKELVQPGDRLLFKASRAVGLERVVEQFVQE